MAEVDGPYALGKAAWDRMNIDGLADWYRPHLERLTGLMAPSSSVYLWNTAEGWARLDPEMRRLGWEFRTLIVWDKRTPPSMLGWRTIRTWPDQIEVCGFYQRGRPHFALTECMGSVWDFSVKALSLEQEKAPEQVRHRGSEGDVFSALHPCQKPLLFAERMVQASTRPGDRILVPFGGTCRIATYLERLSRTHPEEMRRHDTAELNQDGKDYLSAVLGRMGEDTGKAGQMALFGAR
jgi:DNA modification methylase